MKIYKLKLKKNIFLIKEEPNEEIITGLLFKSLKEQQIANKVSSIEYIKSTNWYGHFNVWLNNGVHWEMFPWEISHLELNEIEDLRKYLTSEIPAFRETAKKFT